MPLTGGTVVTPADARLVLGSLQQQSHFFIKEKFFAYEELLGEHQQRWLRAFAGGDVVICRLTPEKYHYTHCSVSGIVRDIYDLPGAHHSCHPIATVALATPFSKNRRVRHYHRYRRCLWFWSRSCRHDRGGGLNGRQYRAVL